MDLQSCFLHQSVGLSPPSLELAPADSPWFPNLSLTSHQGWSANTCGVFVSLFYRDAVGFFFNLLIVFDKHCFCLWAPMFSSQEGPISSSNLISSCHIPKHLDQLPHADPYFTWLKHTFWKCKLFCFENMKRCWIHQSFELLIPLVNGIHGQHIHPFISLKKHFYQFCSPCNGFQLCREPRVPLFQEHLLLLIETVPNTAL